MVITQIFRKVLRRAGFDIVRYSPTSSPEARRTKLFDTFNIDTVIDVGANVGQFGRELRGAGYRGKIFSFEPLSDAYRKLKHTSEADGRWVAFNVGLGASNTGAQLNIAGNSQSSSILEMLPAHVKSAPVSEYVGREFIKVVTLDSVYSNICDGVEGIYLKIDTQGYENHVLDGAGESLRHIDTIQLEMSLVPLYEDAWPFHRLCELMTEKGYHLIAVEPGFTDRDTGCILQVDGIFHRFADRCG